MQSKSPAGSPNTPKTSRRPIPPGTPPQTCDRIVIPPTPSGVKPPPLAILSPSGTTPRPRNSRELAHGATSLQSLQSPGSGSLKLNLQAHSAPATPGFNIHHFAAALNPGAASPVVPYTPRMGIGRRKHIEYVFLARFDIGKGSVIELQHPRKTGISERSASNRGE